MAIALDSKSPEACLINVVLDSTLQIPSCSEVEVMRRIPIAATHETWIVEGNTQRQSAVMVARAIVEPESTKVSIQLLNPRDEQVTIQKEWPWQMLNH